MQAPSASARKTTFRSDYGLGFSPLHPERDPHEHPVLKQAEISATFARAGSTLVRRLVRARNDPGKERIHGWLIDLDDAQLQSRLGLTLEDIALLRGGGPGEIRVRGFSEYQTDRLKYLRSDCL
jgi:hypothetical protein